MLRNSSPFFMALIEIFQNVFEIHSFLENLRESFSVCWKLLSLRVKLQSDQNFMRDSKHFGKRKFCEETKLSRPAPETHETITFLNFALIF